MNTVYGPGYVAEIRQKDYVVKLANWALAQGQSPTLYLAAESMRYDLSQQQSTTKIRLTFDHQHVIIRLAA